MNADLAPYPEYGKSGDPWVGRVPGHWNVRRIKTVFREKDGRSGDGAGVLLSLTRERGIVPQADISNRIASAEDLSKYKVCRPGDLIMNRMQAWSGMFALSPSDGLVSPDYSVFEAIGNSEAKYFEYLFRTPILVDEFARRSKGIGSGFNRLYTPDFGAVSIPVPPFEEQAAIVRFLDHADRRIRRFIGAKKRLIALLNEQKQAIVHRAVTRGLDPNPRLKPSGVEWLGDIPEHWEVMLTQRIFKEQIRPPDGQEVQLSLSQRDGLVATSEMLERTLQTSTFENWKVAVPGDLVLNRFKAHLGVFFASHLWGIVSFHYGVFAPRRPLTTKYFELLFHTNPYRAIFAVRSNGITVGLQNLSNQNFYNVRSVVPPVKEQAEIVAFVAGATQRLTDTVDVLRREIAFLHEYRTRLIADVVTGKVDVLEAAASVPDEAEPEPLDEADFITDANESEVEADLDTEGGGAQA
jgi:type I restriction enzyme, S subunit